MWRGFSRPWVVISALWVGVWLGLGASHGLVVTPAHEIRAPVDRVSLGLPPDASDSDFKLAILQSGTAGKLPVIQIPAAFNAVGTVGVLCGAASAPALLLAIGWAFAGFARPIRLS